MVRLVKWLLRAYIEALLWFCGIAALLGLVMLVAAARWLGISVLIALALATSAYLDRPTR